ncbi:MULTISPECIES: hypothetical protein [unclassified Microbacterium]|uniref:hypothetical protein n=1 Tax=unclassified Microbacterium TaxID=2609290 RepID=UPI0030189C99
MSRLLRTVLAGALGVVALASLAGCALLTGSARPDADAAVTQLVRDMSHRRADDIDGWARLAEEASDGHGASIVLIGITAQTADVSTDPLGTLSFRVEATRSNTGLWSAGTASFTACYAVDFTRYGPVDHERAGRAASPIRTIECPDTVVEATPAPDTSPVFVVPADAADVILAVVAEAPAAAASGDLVDAIESRLTAPSGPYERLAPIDVVRISDGSIGAAMGTESTCVLVRRVGEVTEQVHAPRVYLQPGELGCRGTTALGDLRPPH